MLAVAKVARDDIILAVERQVGVEVARQQRVARDREAGQAGIARIGVAAGDADRIGQIADRAIVEIFAVEADIAAREGLGQVRLELAAAIAVIADPARPLALTVETADVIAQAAVDLAAIVEIDAIFLIVEPRAELQRAPFLFAGLGDQVEHAARRIGREGGGRSAPDRLDRRQVQVGAQEDVGIAEGDVAEFEDGQAVLL